MNQILIDSNNPSLIFATTTQFQTRPALYKSTNAGATWVRTGPRVALSLLEDPASSLLYGFNRVSFYRSTDLGRTWNESANGLIERGIQTGAVDPANPSVLYVGAFKGVYASSDKGKTWARRSNGVTGYIWDVAASAVRKGQVYVATEDGFFRSSDGGRTWAKRNAGLPAEARYGDIGLSPNGQLFLSSYEGRNGNWVYRSTNNGETWMRLAFEFNRASQFLFDQSNGSIFYVTSEFDSVWKTTDGGNTFSDVSPEQPDCEIPSAALDPRDASILFVSACGIRKSTDGGQSYVLLKTEGLATTSIYAPPTQRNVAYAGTYSGLFQSVSAGAQWRSTGLQPGSVSCIQGPFDSPNVLYACVIGDSTGIYKSTDSGKDWLQVHPMPDQWPQSLSISRANSNVLYATSGNTEILRSTDAGASWSVKSVGIYVEAIAPDSASTQTVYVLGRHQLRKSTDGGDSWTTATAGLAPYRAPIAIEVHPVRSNELYAALQTGVFHSTDSGASWQRTSEEIPDCITSFFMDPLTPELLYAATRFFGVFRSTDGGNSWSRMRMTGILTASSEYGAIDSLAADSLNQTVYAGTESGVYQIGPVSVSQPFVWGISPALYRSEKSITLTGRNFGTTPGNVLINQSPAGKIRQWSDTRIVIDPSTAETGDMVVVAQGRRINPVEFLVEPVSGISPNHGPSSGGTLMTMDPRRQIYPDLSVLFGDTIANIVVPGSKRTSCGYNRYPLLIVRTPPHARGSVAVTFGDTGGLPRGNAGIFRYE